MPKKKVDTWYTEQDIVNVLKNQNISVQGVKSAGPKKIDADLSTAWAEGLKGKKVHAFSTAPLQFNKEKPEELSQALKYAVLEYLLAIQSDPPNPMPSAIRITLPVNMGNNHWVYIATSLNVTESFKHEFATFKESYEKALESYSKSEKKVPLSDYLMQDKAISNFLKLKCTDLSYSVVDSMEKEHSQLSALKNALADVAGKDNDFKKDTKNASKISQADADSCGILAVQGCTHFLITGQHLTYNDLAKQLFDFTRNENVKKKISEDFADALEGFNKLHLQMEGCLKKCEKNLNDKENQKELVALWAQAKRIEHRLEFGVERSTIFSPSESGQKYDPGRWTGLRSQLQDYCARSEMKLEPKTNKNEKFLELNYKSGELAGKAKIEVDDRGNMHLEVDKKLNKEQRQKAARDMLNAYIAANPDVLAKDSKIVLKVAGPEATLIQEIAKKQYPELAVEVKTKGKEVEKESTEKDIKKLLEDIEDIEGKGPPAMKI